MKLDRPLTLDRAMARAGSIAGIAGVLAYFGAAFVPAPDPVSRLLAFAFGPLLAVSFLGLFHLLARHRDGPALRFGVAFGLMAGVAVTTMLVVQVGNNMVLSSQLLAADGPAAAEAARQLHQSVNRVQYLMDVVWDIFITSAGALVGWAMLRHPCFGRVWGGSGIAASVLLLYLNLGTFPRGPAYAGSVDVGPLLAVWFLAVYARGLWLSRPGSPLFQPHAQDGVAGPDTPGGVDALHASASAGARGATPGASRNRASTRTGAGNSNR
ncbi:MAG: hypothetical protein GWN85_28175 [Gemmatimonadetes bacterium]|nr:hypothetical protein [Gemmatimonadota bacterium]